MRWNLHIIGIFIVLFGVCSCENDIETIKSLARSNKLPSLYVAEARIIYSDDAHVRLVIEAPELIKIDSIRKQTVYQFPQGITAYFYNERDELETTITAKKAVYYEYKKVWEGTNGVVAKNIKEGDELQTDHVFWDQDRGIITSDSHTKIINKDGIFYGERGFEADDSFTKWKLYGTKGTVTIKD